MGEGELSADVIEKKKLIDNHYYAIANKARPPQTALTLTHPVELGCNPM